jgi:non-specific serine/threonine protein kinase
MSLWDRILSWFQRTRFEEVPLEFEVDYNNGYHEIMVYVNPEDGEKQRLTNIADLWNHGYFSETEKEKKIIPREDFETLLAIRALNPKLEPSGIIRSEVYPSVLNYLREHKKVKETESSREIKIHDEPIPRVAELEYQTNKGIEAKFGYKIEGKDEIIQIDDLEETADPEYSRVGKEFYLKPVEEDSQIRKLLQSKRVFIPDSDIPEFLLKDLALIKSNFNAVLLGVNELEVIDEDMLPQFSLDVGEKGWLDFMVTYKLGDHVLPLDVFKKGKKGYIKLSDTEWAKIDENQIKDLKKQLREFGVKQEKDAFKTEISRFQSLEELIDHIGGNVAVSEAYQEFESELTDFSYNEKYMLPNEIEKTLVDNEIFLRNYQRAGIHWLNWLSDHYLHGILADDMGLGKTIQAIINMRLNYEEEQPGTHSLIICPRSVLRHWEREIKRAWPDARVHVYHGSTRRKRIFSTKSPKIFITTYATATNDLDILQNVPFFYLILDEGTRIKNPQAKRSRAIKSMNAAHRYVLSGTPIENRPAELWSIFDFLMKGHLGSYGGFVSQIEKPIINGDQEKTDYLAKRISPFILRRLKEEVAKDLPEKIEIKNTCGLTDEQRSLYGQLQDLYVDPVRRALMEGENVSVPGTILPVITKLKQVCDHPALINDKDSPILGRSEKFDIMADKLSEITENGDQLVLFSHFLKTLDLFEKYTADEALDFIRIDGSTSNRQRLIDRFNKKGVPVALCSLLAAGHGINLTSANHVLHVDRWWNPAVEDQATDRVHRIGQNKTVFVHHVLTEGTLEERILKILERKRGISDAVISAAGGLSGWTREELLELLEPLRI